MRWPAIDPMIALISGAAVLSVLAVVAILARLSENRMLTRLRAEIRCECADMGSKLESCRIDVTALMELQKQRSAHDPENDAAQEPPGLRTQAWRMQGQGRDVSTIATTLGIRQAEVELLLKLRAANLPGLR